MRGSGWWVRRVWGEFGMGWAGNGKKGLLDG